MTSAKAPSPKMVWHNGILIPNESLNKEKYTMSNNTFTVQPKAIEKFISVLGFLEFISFVIAILGIPIGLIAYLIVAYNSDSIQVGLLIIIATFVIVTGSYIQAVCAKGLSAIAAMIHNLYIR